MPAERLSYYARPNVCLRATAGRGRFTAGGGFPFLSLVVGRRSSDDFAALVFSSLAALYIEY